MKRETMTFEEACIIEPINYWEKDTDTQEYKDKKIKNAIIAYNYHLGNYNTYKQQVIENLKNECEKVQDDFSKLDIRFESKEQYANRYLPQLRFNAWSERYVYVTGTYDDNDWVVAVERNPCDNLIEPIGGR